MSAAIIEMGVQTLPVAIRDTVRTLIRNARAEGDAEGWERGRREAAADARALKDEERRTYPHREAAQRVTDDLVATVRETGQPIFLAARLDRDGKPTFSLIDPTEALIRSSEHPGAGA